MNIPTFPKQEIIPIDAPFENLVLEGGGVKGIAYVGALKALETKGILKNIKRVGGSSAGGITALLIALGYTPEEIQQEMESIEFMDFQDSRAKYWSKWPRWMDTKHQHIRKFLFNTGALSQVLIKKKVGVYEGEIFLQWAKSKIAKKLGDPNATFADLKKAMVMNSESEFIFKELMLTATKIGGQGRDVLQYFDAEKTPNVRIADAIRATMSFPGAFETYDIAINGVSSTYVDGGLGNNYPMEYYDDGKFLSPGNALNSVGINPFTLGLRIDTKKEIDTFKHGQGGSLAKDGKINEAYSWRGFARGMKEALMCDRDKVHHKYYGNSIQIEDAGIATLDFALGDTDKNLLMQNGQKAVNEWHEIYREGGVFKAVKHYQTCEEYYRSRSDEELLAMYAERMSNLNTADAIRDRDAIKAARPELFDKTPKQMAVEAMNKLLDMQIDYADQTQESLQKALEHLKSVIREGAKELKEQEFSVRMLEAIPKESQVYKEIVECFAEVNILQDRFNEKRLLLKESMEPEAMVHARLVIEFQAEKQKVVNKLHSALEADGTVIPNYKKIISNLLEVHLDRAEKGIAYKLAEKENYYDRCLIDLKIENSQLETTVDHLKIKLARCSEQIKVKNKALAVLHNKRRQCGDDFNNMCQLSLRLKTFVNDQDSIFTSLQKVSRFALKLVFSPIYEPVKKVATIVSKKNVARFEGFENRFVSNQELYRQYAIELQLGVVKNLNNWNAEYPKENIREYINILGSIHDKIKRAGAQNIKLFSSAKDAKQQLLQYVEQELFDMEILTKHQEMIETAMASTTESQQEKEVDEYIKLVVDQREEEREALIKQLSVELSENPKVCSVRIEKLLLPFNRKLEELNKIKALKELKTAKPLRL